jgi:hypothetical protein
MSQHRGNAASARDRDGLNLHTTVTPTSGQLIENENACGARRVFQPLVSFLRLTRVCVPLQSLEPPEQAPNLNRHKLKLNWAHLIENKQRSSVQIATKLHFFQEKRNREKSARSGLRSPLGGPADPGFRRAGNSTGVPTPDFQNLFDTQNYTKRQSQNDNSLKTTRNPICARYKNGSSEVRCHPQPPASSLQNTLSDSATRLPAGERQSVWLTHRQKAKSCSVNTLQPCPVGHRFARISHQITRTGGGKA